MASIDIAVATVALALIGDNNSQQITASLRTSANANVVTTGGAFTLNVLPANAPGGFSAALGMQSETPILLSYASGLSVLEVAGALNPGSYNYELLFTPSGGTAQVVQKGSLQVI